MSMHSLDLKVRVAWWVRPYLAGVGLFVSITGMEPDWDKVRSMALRGITVVVSK